MTSPRPIPDPMKGIRGVFAAVLVLEAIVVLLALLVLSKFGDGATPLSAGLVVGVAVLMIVGSGLQRRSWGLAFALVMQAVTVVVGFVFVPVLGVMGIVFALVFGGLILMRRDVARKMARGELPGQQV